MAARFKYAKKKASDLLSGAGVKGAPVNVEKIATLLNATVCYEPLDDKISGLLTHTEEGAPVIGINARHAVARQRFSIAHELGHLALHNEPFHVDGKSAIALRSPKSSTGTDEKEIEANQFAAELLMPAEVLFRDIRKLPDNMDVEAAINKLASKYKVSVQAMTIRLTSLGVLP